MADPKSAGLKALLGTADALWPIILGVEVWYLIPAMGWSLSTGQFTVGTTTLFLMTLSTVAWAANGLVDFLFVIGELPHDVQARHTAEGSLIMTGILFSVMSLLNIILFWIEIMTTSRASDRIYNIASSVFWLRIATGIFAVCSLVAIGLNLAGFAAAFVLGVSVATVYYLGLSVGLLIIGAKLRCVLSQNLAAHGGPARRTAATVSLLQLLAGTSCAVFVVTSIMGIALQNAGDLSFVAFVVGRIALACVAAVVTYAVGVTSTAPDSADDARSTASKQPKATAPRPGGHRAPGLGRSAAVAPNMAEDADDSLVHEDDAHDSEAGHPDGQSSEPIPAGQSSATSGSRAQHGVAPLTVDTSDWSSHGRSGHESHAIGQTIEVPVARGRATTPSAEASAPRRGVEMGKLGSGSTHVYVQGASERTGAASDGPRSSAPSQGPASLASTPHALRPPPSREDQPAKHKSGSWGNSAKGSPATTPKELQGPATGGRKAPRVAYGSGRPAARS
ncbi:hypothetical protein FNF29_06364 [Cafeteria roenbergensis]|uniref:Transmembrane protein n=1 Tax=Cafeteria roenbergensis TaxID=33653 RepID=A0A5A8CA01_CAFRO|nr:hypothetical protein FNF29_06364 [Cafeteria roenbergensis]|eukprot:KAA0148890.1 hypothetical protein FNF29_06364 [Cafeteria roenbergensis]